MYAPLGPTEELERYLGDPRDPTVPFSFVECARLDSEEAFPTGICNHLERWGLHRFYVPARYGGRLGSYEEAMHLLRVVARRDLTVAIGHGKTFLGSISVWIGGNHAQAQRLAAKVLAGASLAWGLTERAHGSDLLANEVSATLEDGHYLISGEKWLINNATRGSVIVLLARTDPAGGPRGFGVLTVEKDALPVGSFQCLPKIRTLGIRGADISGIAFDRAAVPTSAHVGRPGGGIELVLKALQVTRIMCTGLSLGSGDHGLRIATRWARTRELYGRRLGDLPQARRVLLDAYTDQLAGEAMSIVAARSIHHLPEELSIVSAAVKYLVPVQTEASITRLGRLLGARSVWTSGFSYGMFQKVARDAKIVPLFDGSTVVNLNAIISQFGLLSRAYRHGGAWAESSAVHDVSVRTPEVDYTRLALTSRHGLAAVRTLKDSVATLARLASRRPELAPTVDLAQRFERLVDTLHGRIGALAPTPREVPSGHFRAAAQYARCCMGAMALGLWLASHDHVASGGTGDIWRDGIWLRAVLRRTLQEAGEPIPPDPCEDEIMFARLVDQYTSGQMFSLFPCKLSEGPHT